MHIVHGSYGAARRQVVKLQRAGLAGHEIEHRGVKHLVKAGVALGDDKLVAAVGGGAVGGAVGAHKARGALLRPSGGQVGAARKVGVVVETVLYLHGLLGRSRSHAAQAQR